MTTHFVKQLAILAFGTTIGLVGLTNSTAHADSLKTLEHATYVKTTRAMYTGQSTLVNGKRGHKIITPRGTILKVSGFWQNSTSGTPTYSASLSRGDLHYATRSKIYPANQTITFKKTSDFKAYTLKMPGRARLLQSGNGYTNTATSHYKPIFHVTLDGYVEYYSTARLKHYSIYDANQLGKAYSLPNGNQSTYTPDVLAYIKPTTTVKVATFKVTGNTAYLYYKRPINGLTEKQVSSRYYRLTIQKTNSHLLNQTWHPTTDDGNLVNAWWNRYTVGGHHYFDLVEVEAVD